MTPRFAPVLLFTLAALLPPPAAAQAGSVLPVEIANNMLFVEAEVDGRRGWFFFDSGAPRLALNAARFPGRATHGVERGAGATGAHSAPQTQVGRFALGHLVQENFSAGMINLTHLERATGRDVLGLIGYENLKADVVHFDYAARQVRLLPAAALGHFPAPRVVIPFEFDRHLPTFTADLNGRSLKVAIDSGASAGIIDAVLTEELQGQLQAQGSTAVHGVTGSTAGSLERLTATLRVGETTFADLPFVFLPLPQFRALGATFDAVIGYHVLAPRPSAIDYAGKRLLFW